MRGFRTERCASGHYNGPRRPSRTTAKVADQLCALGLGPSSSLPPGGWEHSQVTVERDGRISATTGASPHGQGNETTFAQMLADQFGVPLDHVTIHHGDTAVVKQGIGTFGNRSPAVGGAALHDAGAKVRAKMAKFAAALLEAHETIWSSRTAPSRFRARQRRPGGSPRLPPTPTGRSGCPRDCPRLAAGPDSWAPGGA